MKDAKSQTVLFLFGHRPAEPAILQAGALLRQLPRLGWKVRVAALSVPAAELLGGRLGQSVERISALAGLPVLGRLFARLHASEPANSNGAGSEPCHPSPGKASSVLAVVHAWDWQAARIARAIAGPDAHICLTLTDTDVCDRSARRLLRPADQVTCYSEQCSRKLLEAGLPAGQVHLIAPAVEADLFLPTDPPSVGDPRPPGDPSSLGNPPSSSRRWAIRAALGIDPHAGPIVAAPPPVGRGSGHFEVAWGIFIVRRAGLPAQLLLPHPGREAERIRRFGASCHEEAGIVTCPAGTAWPDLLAAADVIVLPDREQIDPVLATWALASGRPVVIRDGIATSPESTGSSSSPLLSPQICLFTPDARPLSLARTVLRAWQDRQAAVLLPQAALEQIHRQYDPMQAAAAAAQLYV